MPHRITLRIAISLGFLCSAVLIAQDENTNAAVNDMKEAPKSSAASQASATPTPPPAPAPKTAPSATETEQVSPVPPDYKERKEKEDSKKPTADESKMVLQSLSKRYQAMGSWGSTFFQTEKSPGIAKEISSDGYFKFVIAGGKNKFLLVTKNAQMTKKFVSDGVKAIYVEDRGPGKKDRYFARKFDDAKALELERFLLFFRGLKRNNGSEKDFDVSGVFNKPDLQITLIPKKESDFTEIKILFQNADKYPKQLAFKDAVGGETTLKMLKTESLSKFDPRWFDLTLPKGAKTE